MKQPPAKTKTIYFIKSLGVLDFADKIKLTAELKYGQQLVEFPFNGKTVRVPYSSILYITEEDQKNG